MSVDILQIVVQGGAVALLALVLWQISLKIDRAMENMQTLLIKVLDMLAETKNAAEKLSQKSDRNFVEIKRQTPPKN